MPLYVNDAPLNEQEVLQEKNRLRPKHDDVFQSMDEKEREEQLRSWAQENVVERLLLRQAAEEYGRQLPTEYFDEMFASLVAEQGGEAELLRRLEAHGASMSDFRKEFDLQLSIERLIDSVTKDVPGVDEAELLREYEADPTRYMTPELVRAGHVVLYVNEQRSRDEALQGIRQIQQMLKEGTAFESLAARYSDCPDNDGDLGFFPRGEMVEEFENVVFALQPGEMSDVIETPFGFHIAKLYEKRPSTQLAFDEVKERIREERVHEMKDRLLEEFIDTLRAAATIVEKP
jgi:parvulin-like peptidyl-prolyl isomerase